MSFDIAAYRALRTRAYPGGHVELRADGTFDAPGWPTRGNTERSTHWPTVVTVGTDDSVWTTLKTAATILGTTTAGVHAMRRRGELRSIGATATELKRLRELAGWTEPGWSAQVFVARADVEALARREAA